MEDGVAVLPGHSYLPGDIVMPSRPSGHFRGYLIVFDLLLVLLGLAGLIIGSELLVRGSVCAVKAFGISPLVIGFALVVFGTSTPELVTSL